MNKEQAKAWLPLIQAMAEGKTLQVQHIHRWMGNQSITWNDIRFLPESLAAYDVSMYRIKPEPKKQSFRVALLEFDVRDFGAANKKNVYVASAVEGGKCDDLSKQSNFIRWLTDRIEYELPEVEA